MTPEQRLAQLGLELPPALMAVYKPLLLDGCSELFAHVWGEENGIGVRSAVGMGSLPDNIPVEIEALFELL